MIVLDTTKSVVEQAQHVQIDDAAIAAWAKTTTAAQIKPAGHELYANVKGTQAQLANFMLLIDALNFCFWSAKPISFEWRGTTYERFAAMFVSLMLAARYEPKWFDAEYWVSIPSADLREALAGQGELLLMDERETILRQTGQALIDRFDGQFLHAIESVNEQAWPLAVLLMTNFDSFRDVAGYRGHPVYFMKRAEICAIDISATFELHDHPPLAGVEQLTAFADYRVPQALRHLNILTITPELAEHIDADRELDEGCEQEIELRAASIHAVDRMAKAATAAGLGQGRRPVAPWQIDWYLWGVSHDPAVSVHHHRTRTIYY